MDACIIKLINRIVGTLHKKINVWHTNWKTKKNTSLHFYNYRIDKLQNDLNLKKIKENEVTHEMTHYQTLLYVKQVTL